jgi:hypothetical protein
MNYILSRVQGVEYTPEAVNEIRTNLLIPLRDKALETNQFTYAVGLSHVIAYMAEFAERLQIENG